jgi:hypothetical protein
MSTTFGISRQLSQVLGTDEAVCVLTGAGVSAESGVPTLFAMRTGCGRNTIRTNSATPQASFEAIPIWFGVGIPGGASASPPCCPNAGMWRRGIRERVSLASH